jgi:hypothetical protein
MGCGTLPDGTLRLPVDQDGKVGMGVDVDESRCNEASCHIYALLSLKCSSRGYFDDLSLLDSQVTPEPGIPATV